MRKAEQGRNRGSEGTNIVDVRGVGRENTEGTRGTSYFHILQARELAWEVDPKLSQARGKTMSIVNLESSMANEPEQRI